MTTYSYSRINTFENCPLKYKFNYVDRIKRYVEGVEAFLGNRCHSVLEKLYKDKLKGKDNSLDDLLKHYNSEWSKKWHDDIKVVRKEFTPEHYKNVGEKALKDYYQRYHPFDQSKTLGLEKRVNLSLNSGDNVQYSFMGYIDRLSETTDGEYEVHDYKTSGNLPDQASFDSDRQLALYQIAVEQLWPNAKKVHLIWHYLVFDKEIRSYRTAKELEKLKKQFLTSISNILKAQESNTFEAKESALCNWCDYPDLCPKRKHLFSVSSLPENEYLKDDGVKLVNKYASLVNDFKDKKAAFEEEKSKILEALVQYANKNSLDKVSGSEYEANIKKEKKGSFPRANEPEREKLDKLLKDIGIWEKVSSLSSTRLSKTLLANGLTDEQIEKIKEFQTVEERISVSLAKYKDTQ